VGSDSGRVGATLCNSCKDVADQAAYTYMAWAPMHGHPAGQHTHACTHLRNALARCLLLGSPPCRWPRLPMAPLPLERRLTAALPSLALLPTAAAWCSCHLARASGGCAGTSRHSSWRHWAAQSRQRQAPRSRHCMHTCTTERQQSAIHVIGFGFSSEVAKTCNLAAAWAWAGQQSRLCWWPLVPRLTCASGSSGLGATDIPALVR